MKDLLCLEVGGKHRTISDAIFEKEWFIPDIAFECDTVHILKRMVQEGLGIASGRSIPGEVTC